MKKILELICTIIILISSINCIERQYSHSNKENNLYFVFSSFRHGARKPFVKLDIFNNKIKNPGSLTSYGKQQHLNIGKKNRERYFKFLNLGKKKFDTEQILVRSSKIKRVVTSTKMQLQGMLNSKEYNNIIQSIKLRKNLFVLYNINIKDNIDIFTFHKTSCNNQRKLNQEEIDEKYSNEFYTNILPLFEKCYGKYKLNTLMTFCDQEISAYYEYYYESKKKNNIGKCDTKSINKINNFCVNYLDSLRGWSEINAYHFYTFFRTLFKYMKDVIDGMGKLKMILIGGHDSSVNLLLNFFDGINIINRTGYPHYAYNIIMELREYNKQFYIEIYYNDILKYNRTLEEFKSILINSKYSDMNNYCENFGNVTHNLFTPQNEHKIWIKAMFIIFVIIFCMFFSFEYFSLRKNRNKMRKINIEENMKKMKDIKDMNDTSNSDIKIINKDLGF